MFIAYVEVNSDSDVGPLNIVVVCSW